MKTLIMVVVLLAHQALWAQRIPKDFDVYGEFKVYPPQGEQTVAVVLPYWLSIEQFESDLAQRLVIHRSFFQSEDVRAFERVILKENTWWDKPLGGTSRHFAWIDMIGYRQNQRYDIRCLFQLDGLTIDVEEGSCWYWSNQDKGWVKRGAPDMKFQKTYPEPTVKRQIKPREKLDLYTWPVRKN